MLQAVMGGVTDIILMLLPLPNVIGLQLSWKHKAALVAWFGTGLLTLGAAIARLVILVPSLKTPDTTYILAQGTQLTTVNPRSQNCRVQPHHNLRNPADVPHLPQPYRAQDPRGEGRFKEPE